MKYNRGKLPLQKYDKKFEFFYTKNLLFYLRAIKKTQLFARLI